MYTGSCVNCVVTSTNSLQVFVSLKAIGLITMLAEMTRVWLKNES